VQDPRRLCATPHQGASARVERWFALLVEVSNENPRLYLWTKSADDIRDNLSRFCGRPLETQALANF